MEVAEEVSEVSTLELETTRGMHCLSQTMYRAEKKSWYVVARRFFLLLLNFSAWPCLGPA